MYKCDFLKKSPYSSFVKSLNGSNQRIHDYFKKESTKTKVYFLFLQKAQSVTEVSRFMYDKKIRLTQISKIRQDFESLGIIEEKHYSLEELRAQGAKGEDLRKQYWKANYLPVIKYFEENIEERWGGQFVKEMSIFTREEANTIELILDSNWFKNILLYQHFCKETDAEIDFLSELQLIKSSDGKISNELLSDPFYWMSRAMINIGCIALAYSNAQTVYPELTCNDINLSGNFDTFVANQESKLTKNQKKYIKTTLDKAKKDLGYLNVRRKVLGFRIEEYENLVHIYDVIMKHSAPVFIPKTLA